MPNRATARTAKAAHMPWTVEEEMLSDESIVYNVTNGECWIACISETAAHRLLDAISANTVEQVQ